MIVEKTLTAYFDLLDLELVRKRTTDAEEGRDEIIDALPFLLLEKNTFQHFKMVLLLMKVESLENTGDIRYSTYVSDTKPKTGPWLFFYGIARPDIII